MDCTPPPSHLEDETTGGRQRRSILRSSSCEGTDQSAKDRRLSVSFNNVKEVRYMDNDEIGRIRTEEVKLTPISESASDAHLNSLDSAFQDAEEEEDQEDRSASSNCDVHHISDFPNVWVNKTPVIKSVSPPAAATESNRRILPSKVILPKLKNVTGDTKENGAFDRSNGPSISSPEQWHYSDVPARGGGATIDSGTTPIFPLGPGVKGTLSELFAQGLTRTGGVRKSQLSNRSSASPIPPLSANRPRIKRSVMSIAGGPPVPLESRFRPSLLSVDCDVPYLEEFDDMAKFSSSSSREDAEDSSDESADDGANRSVSTEKTDDGRLGGVSVADFLPADSEHTGDDDDEDEDDDEEEVNASRPPCRFGHLEPIDELNENESEDLTSNDQMPTAQPSKLVSELDELQPLTSEASSTTTDGVEVQLSARSSAIDEKAFSSSKITVFSARPSKPLPPTPPISLKKRKPSQIPPLDADTLREHNDNSSMSKAIGAFAVGALGPREKRRKLYSDQTETKYSFDQTLSVEHQSMASTEELKLKGASSQHEPSSHSEPVVQHEEQRPPLPQGAELRRPLSPASERYRNNEKLSPESQPPALLISNTSTKENSPPPWRNKKLVTSPCEQMRAIRTASSLLLMTPRQAAHMADKHLHPQFIQDEPVILFSPGSPVRIAEPRRALLSILGLDCLAVDLINALQGLKQEMGKQSKDFTPCTFTLKSLLEPEASPLRQLAAQLSYNIACGLVEQKAKIQLEQQLNWGQSYEASRVLDKLKSFIATTSGRGGRAEIIAQLQDASRLRADIAETQCRAMWRKHFQEPVTTNCLHLTYNFMKGINEILEKDLQDLLAKKEDCQALEQALEKTLEQKRTKEQLLELWKKGHTILEDQKGEAQQRVAFARKKVDELKEEENKLTDRLRGLQTEQDQKKRHLDFLQTTVRRLSDLKRKASIAQGWRISSPLSGDAKEVVVSVDGHKFLGHINPFAYEHYQASSIETMAADRDREVAHLRHAILKEAWKNQSIESLAFLGLPAWRLTYAAGAQGIMLKEVKLRSTPCVPASVPPPLLKVMGMGKESLALKQVNNAARLFTAIGFLALWTISLYLKKGGQRGTPLAAFAWICLGNVKKVVEDLLKLQQEFQVFKGDFLHFTPPSPGEKSSEAHFAVHIYGAEEIRFTLRFLLDVELKTGSTALYQVTYQIDASRALKYGSLVIAGVKLELRRFSPGMTLVARIGGAELSNVKRKLNVTTVAQLARYIAARSMHTQRN